MRRVCLAALLAFAFVSVSASVGWALVLIADSGNWPADWPQELEPLRASSKTLGIATGIQEEIYEIPIPDRETFEKVWPALLKVRTPESPVTLYAAGMPAPKAWGDLLSNKRPTVRIYAPPRSEGIAAAIAAVVGKNGALPEFVLDQKTTSGQPRWGPADPRADKPPRGFYLRARTDLELVVDGQVIDLSRIKLPEHAQVVDHRSEGQKSPPAER